MRKQLVRFYFNADRLDRALNNLIFNSAIKSREAIGSGERYADNIIDIIDLKDEFQSLWAYIHGEISDFNEEDMQALAVYARSGLNGLSVERERKVKSALIKFMRRIKFISRYERAVKLVRQYYCLM